jgi:prevent-host-death family protein
MATDIPQRQLRNHTADLLRRVEEGERLRITVHGHPVAELVPIEERPKRFVPRERFEELAVAGDPEAAREWIEEIHQIRREMGPIRDPWEKLEEINADRKREASEER